MKRTGQAGTKAQARSLAKKNGRAGAREKADGLAREAPFDLHAVLYGLQAMSAGEFSVRLPGHWTGLEGKIADTFNEIVAANQKMAQELKRVGQVVGKQGKTQERTRFDQSKGAWGEMEVSVNTLIDDLLRPTTEVTRAIAAAAQGNLTQTVHLGVDGRPLEGEFLRSATIVNTMIQRPYPERTPHQCPEIRLSRRSLWGHPHRPPGQSRLCDIECARHQHRFPREPRFSTH